MYMSVPNFLRRKINLTQLNRICSIKHQWIQKPSRFKNVDKIVLKVEFLSEHNWNPIKIQ